MRRILTVVCFVGIFFAVWRVAGVSAATGIYRTINFQGKIVNKADGTNISNQSYSFTFKLYDAATNGNQLPTGTPWSETQSLTVTDGIFRATLGSSTPFPTTLDFNSDSLYLDITFNGETFGSRVRLTAVPYAFNAEKVGGLTVTNTTGTLTIPAGKTIQFGDAFTTSGTNPLTLTTSGTTNATLPSGTITLVDLASNQSLSGKTIDTTSAGLIFSGGTTDITTGTNQDFTIVPNGSGMVGIGTTSPTAMLTVKGNATASGNLTMGGQLQVGRFGAEPVGAGVGSMYYNTSTNKFRCFVNSAWADCTTPSLFTDGGTFTYLTSTTNDFILGGTTVAAASFNMDVSAGALYLGTNEAVNGSLTLFSSGVGKTDPSLATNANGDLNLAAPSGQIVVGAGTGNITMSLSGETDTMAADKTVSLTGANALTDYTFKRAFTGGSYAQGGKLFLIQDSSGGAGTINPDLLVVNSALTSGTFTGNLLRLQVGSADKFTVDNTGSLKFSGVTSDITTGTNEDLAIVPNGSGMVGIGTTSTTAMLTVKGNATTSANVTMGGQLQVGRFGAEPTQAGVGSMYYNTSLNKFRCYINATWADCDTTGSTPTWSSLGAPTTNLSLNMYQAVGTSFTTTFTYGNATSTNNLFNITDTASNTGTGYLFNLTTAASSTLKPLHIAAAGTEALMVTAGGNVGVGTTSPAAKLSVEGTASISAALTLGNSTGTGYLQSSYGPLILNYKSNVNSWLPAITIQDSTGLVSVANSLMAGGGTLLPNSPLHAGGSVNSWLQANIQNRSNGTGASSDWVATNDIGTDTSYFVNMGINSSGYNTGTFTIAGANESYLYSQSSSLAIGVADSQATSALKFFTGGTLAANERMRISSNGNVGIGSTAPIQKLDVTGNATVSGDITMGGQLQVGRFGADPAVSSNGSIYYNTSNGKFRCRVNGAWTNCDSTGQTLKIRTTDQSATQSTTTFQNDNTLYYALSPSKTYVVYASIDFNMTNTTADGKYTFTIPSNTTISLQGVAGTTATTLASCNIVASGTTCALAVTATLRQRIIVSGTVTTNSSFTSGNLQFQFAQNTSTAASSPTVLTGSYLTVAESTNFGADLAELYYTNDNSIASGMVVSLDPAIAAGVVKSQKPYDRKVLGIISTNPGLLLSEQPRDGFSQVPVALSGRVPVRVTAENGAIDAGDYLTTSSTPGVAMRADKAGTVIGQALTSYSGSGIGEVTVFVKNTFGDGDFDAVDSNGTLLAAKQVLSRLVSDSASLTGQAGADLSQLYTDRVVAGMDVIAPRVVADMIDANGLVIGGDASGSAAVLIDNHGNASFSGTLTADTIRANHIEGLELMVGKLQVKNTDVTDHVATLAASLDGMGNLEKRIASLEAGITAISASSSDMASGAGKLTDSGLIFNAKVLALDGMAVVGKSNLDDLFVSGTMQIGLLAVNGLDSSASATGGASFDLAAGALLFRAQDGLVFASKSLFNNDVEFAGHVSFNHDAAGYAIVKQGDDRVQIAFTKPYDKTPIVNISVVSMKQDENGNPVAVTPADPNVAYAVTQLDTGGFTIILDKNAARDIRFSWNAVQVKDPETFTSSSQGSVPPPSPTPEPTDLPTPTGPP